MRSGGVVRPIILPSHGKAAYAAQGLHPYSNHSALNSPFYFSNKEK